MAGPFFNAVKGTTAGTPGTGAFTPNAASSTYRAWSTVPTGWWGLVRYDEGTAWELSYSYWNATTLSRAATQRVDSSTGSPLSLTAAATATLVADGGRVAPNPIIPVRQMLPQINSASAPTVFGIAAGVITGTASAAAIATTNYLTEQPRLQIASVTTANGQAAYSHTTAMAVTSTAAGRGGWEFTCRFGASTIPVGPRLFVGMTATTFIANVAEPSALVANYAVFGMDSTDTNIQLLVNSNAGTGTKTDSGILLVANGWYEATIWSDPGSTTVRALLVRVDTGAIWYGTTSTDVPANGALMFPQCIGGLSATTGTAFTLHFGGYNVRAGGW